MYNLNVNKSAKFANILLASFIILFLLMFFYALLRSNVYPPGHIKKYYIFFLTGALFFAYVLFRCSNELKVKISLLMLSLALSIYAIEIILSYHNKAVRIDQNRAKVADYLGIPFDARSKYQVMLDFQKQGIDAYAFHNSTQYMYYEGAEIMPLGFISDKTVIYCNETGKYISYKTDEHGFNNPKGFYSEESIDYVMIGDSFTLGNCVTREDHIAGRLRKTGRKVLNLGMGNTGPLYQLAILKEYGSPFKPKVVLWFFYEGNDHEGIIHEKKSSTLMKYLDKDFSQDLIHKQKLVDHMIIESIEDYVKPFRVSTKSLKKIRDDVNKKNKEATFNISLSTLELSQLRSRLGIAGRCRCKIDPLFKDIIAEAKNITEDWGGQLYFIYLPAWERYPEKTNLCRKHFLNAAKEAVLSVIKNMQIPVIDIESIFSSHPDPLSLFPFRIKGHYNAKGYRLVTEHLEKYLSNKREM